MWWFDVLTWCFSDRASWIDYILITNLMHWLLFIHKILFSSTCFEPQVLIFRRIQLYTCSIWYCHALWEFLVACLYTAWVRWCYKIYIFHVWCAEISCVTKQLLDFREELLVGVPINGWQCWLSAKFIWHRCLQTLCAIPVSAKVWMFKIWIHVCSSTSTVTRS